MPWTRTLPTSRGTAQARSDPGTTCARLALSDGYQTRCEFGRLCAPVMHRVHLNPAGEVLLLAASVAAMTVFVIVQPVHQWARGQYRAGDGPRHMVQMFGQHFVDAEEETGVRQWDRDGGARASSSVRTDKERVSAVVRNLVVLELAAHADRFEARY